MNLKKLFSKRIQRNEPMLLGDFLDRMPDSYVRTEYPHEWDYRKKTGLINHFRIPPPR